jgi:uncharacterized protein YndB with AHSA1/START domain
MTERSVEHAIFVVERRYDAAPENVFAAWSSRDAKAQWFGDPADRFELDFRVGGQELHEGIDPRGEPYSFGAVYQDIVEPERILYTYEMLLGETRISVSVATVELRPDEAGTRLVYTEQAAFLDGHDTPAQRQHGMGSLLDALGRALAPSA